jgi:hypothetical protein
MGYPRRENLARDLLGWAIDHHGPHLLAPILGIDPGALTPDTLRSEKSFADRRIDVTVHRPDIFIDAWQWDPRQPGSREGGGRPWRAASQALVT